MKRVISAILSLLMVVGTLPMTVLADELKGEARPEEAQLLSSSALPDMEYIAGTPYAGFAAEQAKLPEKGLYTLTIRRSGDLSIGSELYVSTVDVSAVYGMDYIIHDSLAETEAFETERTILERSGDETNRLRAQEALESIRSLIENSTQEAAEDTGAAGKTAEDIDPDDLSLAEMKALQSGMPVRETTDSEFTSLAADFLGEMNIDISDYLETSSRTSVTFAPGDPSGPSPSGSLRTGRARARRSSTSFCPRRTIIPPSSKRLLRSASS